MKKNHYYLLISLFFAGVLQAQTGSWVPLTSGTSNNFLGVSAPSSAICYVSGLSGDIRKTSNGGVSWTPLSSGTPQNLFSIFFTNDLIGFAVGDNGTAIKTTDGGTTWAPMSLTTADALKCVWFFDTNTGFISGGVTATTGSIFKTTDGGTTWTALSVPATSIVTSVYFTSLTNGYASSISGNVYKTTSGGTTWGTVSSGITNLQSIQFTSATAGISISQSGSIVRSTTSGTSWSAVTSGTADPLTGMDFYDANNGVIVGGNVPTDAGTILTTSNSGVSWTLSTPGSSRLTKVDFLDASTGYAVGLDGTILKWTIPTTPDAGFTSSAPGCLGQSISFYPVMAAAGVTHSWDFGSGATPATSSSVNPAGVIYSSTGAKLITHIVTNSLGSDSTTSIITVNPSPIVNFTSSAPVCPGSNVDFVNTGTTGAGVTYAWDFGAGSSPINATAQNPTGIIYGTSGTKTVTFSITNQYGCLTSSTQTITINSLPSVTAGPDSTICTGNTVQIGSIAIAGVSYVWSPASTISSASGANPVASPTSPLTTYTVTATNVLTGCSSQDAVTVTVLVPNAANAGADAEICKSDSSQIGVGSIAGQTYMWSPGAGLSDSTIANPNASPTATTTYTLTMSGNVCPSATDQVTVVVHAKPVANAGPDASVPTGGSVQLNASGGVQYSWSPATGLDNASIYNPVASPDVNTFYILTVTDANGCKSNDLINVLIFDSPFWVPTAFTPDGNGISDVFYIRGEGIQNLEFAVFNRWGEQIFFTKDINIGWDGNRQTTGEQLPAGAYAYEIRGSHVDGTPIFAKGIINLIR